MRRAVIFLLLLAMLSGSKSALAQKVSFDNVLKVYLRSAGPIISGKQVTGYYYLYNIDKADKKNNVYRLVITDANLNTVAEKEIIDLKNIQVTDATFNGDNLAFKFINSSKDATQIIRIFDKAAKEVDKKTYPIDPKAYAYSVNFGNDDEIESTDLYGVPGLGFLNFTPTITKGGMVPRPGVEIRMIPRTGSGATSWLYSSPLKSVEIPYFLSQNDEVAFVSIMRRSEESKRDIDFSIAAFNLKTGKKQFDKAFTDDKYELDIISSYFVEDKKENIFFGVLLDKEKKDTKDKTYGMFVAKIDNLGNMTNKTNILWSEFAKQFKPVDEKGNAVDIGNIYIHKIVSTADGRFFAVGERFRKAVSGLGVASMILSGGNPTSLVKLVVEDIVLIEFDQNFKPVKVNFYDKGRSNVQLPGGAGMLGTAILGMYLKQGGFFDYEFTQERDDRSSFSIGYRFRQDKTNFFGTISYKGGTVTQDKINLQTEASKLYVYPGKPGYVMIYEYWKKEKRIDTRLEKINF